MHACSPSSLGLANENQDFNFKAYQMHACSPSSLGLANENQDFNWL